MPSQKEAIAGGFSFSSPVSPSFLPQEFFLAGAGVRGVDIDGNFIVFTAIAVYLEKKALGFVEEKWKGKKACELIESHEFFRDIVIGPFHKLTHVRMVRDLSGEQYSEKVSENCVAYWESMGCSYLMEEEGCKAIEEFRCVFKGRSFPHGSSIFFYHSNTSLVVAFSEDGHLPADIDAVIKCPQLAEAILESIIGKNGVSPETKGTGNVKSFKQTIKRLEEAAVRCRGSERVQLISRWLVALKEIETLPNTSSEKGGSDSEHDVGSSETKETSRVSSQVFYYDTDLGNEMYNFRDVFLYSQALEGITLSMILEAPNEEEVSLLLELFSICLTGGKEVHHAMLSSMQDLAKAFSNFQDEVLVKRVELLQFAQTAITGLKISADITRIDVQSVILRKKLEQFSYGVDHGDGHLQEKAGSVTIDALKQTIAHVRHCSELHELLLKKKMINNGDASDIHSQKVDKLKVLSESLANSVNKAEKRISDNRVQKEEALRFRLTKESDVGETEKDLESEILLLEKQMAGLEAELKQVNASLMATRARLRNVREERVQFEDANNQIVEHFKNKEDDLSRTITSCRIEASVLSTWTNFLEDTWVIQTTNLEMRENQVNGDLVKHRQYFVNLAISLLSAFKEELKVSIGQIENFVENLRNLGPQGSGTSYATVNEDPGMQTPRKSLEEEYLQHESKIVTIFNVVDSLRRQLDSQHKDSRNEEENTKLSGLFEGIGGLRAEFESAERPRLEAEFELPSPSVDDVEKTIEISKSPKLSVDKVVDARDEIAKLESEFGKVSGEYSAEEISGWEFDELEELGSSRG